MEEQQRPQEKPHPVKDESSIGAKEVHHYHYKEKKIWFSPARLFAGILVVLVGVLLLAGKMGLITVDMQLGLFDIWPILVILIGLTMISFRGFIGALIGIVIALLAAVVVCLVLFGNLEIKGSSWRDFGFKLEFSSQEIFQPKVID